MPSDNKTIRKMWELNDENVRLRAALNDVLVALNRAMDLSTPQQVASSGWLGAGVTNSIERIEQALTQP